MGRFVKDGISVSAFTDKVTGGDSVCLLIRNRLYAAVILYGRSLKNAVSRLLFSVNVYVKPAT